MCGSILHNITKQPCLKGELDYICQQNATIQVENDGIRTQFPKKFKSGTQVLSLPSQYEHWDCGYRLHNGGISGAECEVAEDAEKCWNSVYELAVVENGKLRNENLQLRCELDDLWHRGKLRLLRPTVLTQNPPWPYKFKDEGRFVGCDGKHA